MANPASHAQGDSRTDETRISYRLANSLPWFVLPRGIASQVVIDPGLARVPNAKSWLRGVLSLGGIMVPVFDFGDWLEQQPTIDPDCVLVIQPGDEAVAFCAWSVRACCRCASARTLPLAIAGTATATCSFSRNWDRSTNWPPFNGSGEWRIRCPDAVAK